MLFGEDLNNLDRADGGMSMGYSPGDAENTKETLNVRVRFDYRGEKAGKLFGGKNIEKAAEEIREQKAALLRNVPIKGIHINEIEMGTEVYTVYDESTGKESAYAPLEMTLTADSIEDVIRFIMREEFRKIEIIEPPQILFTNKDIERILFKMNEEFNNVLEALEKKLNSR